LGQSGAFDFDAGQLNAMYLRAARAYIHWSKAVFGTQKPMFLTCLSDFEAQIVFGSA
jgi:hypothetical protein